MTFTIPGVAVPKARARTGKGHAYTPARTKAYESKVKMLALKARQEARLKPFQGDVRVRVEIWGLKRGDITNVTKAIEDAMNGVIYEDDRQIQYIETERFDCERPDERPMAPHTNVTVEESP